MFKGPLDRLQSNYFTNFGHGGASPLANQANIADALSPINAYLDSQQTPDKDAVIGLNNPSKQQRSAATSIQKTIPTKTDNGRSRPGAMESVSCSLLKLLCLTPDLEPRSNTGS